MDQTQYNMISKLILCEKLTEAKSQKQCIEVKVTESVTPYYWEASQYIQGLAQKMSHAYKKIA